MMGPTTRRGFLKLLGRTAATAFVVTRFGGVREIVEEVQTASFRTYTMDEMRSDLSRAIYDIDPMDTPFMASYTMGAAAGVRHEWQMDELS